MTFGRRGQCGGVGARISRGCDLWRRGRLHPELLALAQHKHTKVRGIIFFPFLLLKFTEKSHLSINSETRL